MRAGVLIIGSLRWHTQPVRTKWREERLVIEEAIYVGAPLRYGRRSRKRGGTFTMITSSNGVLGQAVIVPCRTKVSDVEGLTTEAEHLWRAERLGTDIGSISASWGTVGVRFRDELAGAEMSKGWAERFARRGVSISPVDNKGVLDIPWPLTADHAALDFDVILAAATKGESINPDAHEVADAWVDQSGGYEAYFFENIRHGIRTPDDQKIWLRIQQRRPACLSTSGYSEAIAILRAESEDSV